MTIKPPPYSCADLAEMKLADLPTSERRIRDKAIRENWKFEEAKSRGKHGVTRLYFPSLKIQREIDRLQKIGEGAAEARAIRAIRAHIRLETEQERNRKTEVALNTITASLTGKGIQKMDAKTSIVFAWREFFHAENQPDRRGNPRKIGKKASFHAFADAYNAGTLKVHDIEGARQTINHLSWKTLQNWVLDNEKRGVVVFADNRYKMGAKVKSQVEAHPRLELAVQAILTDKPHISTVHLREVINHARVDQESGEVLWDEISYDALNRYRKKFEENNKQILLAETNPDAWKNKYLSALGNLSGDIQRLNQRWEMDGTPADWEFVGGRYTASVVIDIYSRRMKIKFSKTARTETNKLLLRDAILDWGLPEEAKTDNGTDYVSREMVLFMEETGIDGHRSTKFSPWEKGHVERAIQTYLHGILELLDNFIGHSVADRKAIDARKTFAENLFTKNAVVKVDMTVEEMQALTDAWLDGTYHVNEHSSLGVSPIEMAASYRGAIRRVENERALDMLLAKPASTMPVITKKGIRYDNARFIHSLLPLPDYLGKQADIRLDPTDLGRLIVYVEGKFVCVAECPERTGINQQEVAAHGRALQKDAIAKAKKAFKAARKSLPMTTDELVKDLLIMRAEKAGKVTVMEKHVEKVETAAMIEAERAAKALEPAPRSPEGDALIAEMRAKRIAAQPKAPVVQIPAKPAHKLDSMSMEQKFELWHACDEMVKDGQVLEDKRMEFFYEKFPVTAGFKALMKMRQEGGL